MSKILMHWLTPVLATITLTACGGGSTPSDEGSLSISGTPPPTAQVGHQWMFEPTIYDPDGGTSTVSVLGKPDWMVLLPSSGLMYGIPEDGDVGISGPISVRLSDGQSNTSLPTFRINVVPQGAPSGSANLRWIPPSERTDGSAIGALSGYRILYGQVSGSYDHVVTINNPGITSSLIKDLGPGTWYFVLVAVTSDGLESAPSAEASKRFGQQRQKPTGQPDSRSHGPAPGKGS